MANNVLIIEDDELLREIYATKLELEGFTVDTAADGLSGLEKATANPPNIILLDMIMPRMTGLEFLHAYQPTKLRPRVVTIIMSNRSSIREISQAKQLGVRDYLIKSHFTPDQVVAKLRLYTQEPDAETL